MAVCPSSPNVIGVSNPRTGRSDYELSLPDIAEIDAECARLRNNQAAWCAGGLDERIATLKRFAILLGVHRDAILEALAADTGRWVLTEMELDGLTGYIGARCSHAAAVLDEPAGGNVQKVSFRQQYVPYSLLAAISPWNYPLILSFLDAVPALLAGCSVAIKPSELTPRFIVPVQAALGDVPELDAVVSILGGDGNTGQALIERSDAVVFTGSVATGRKVAEAAAQAFIPAMLELGGKDPAIVLESADLEAAAHSIMRGSIVNCGQACFATERIYVEYAVYDAFVEKLCSLAGEIEINYPDIRQGHIGPFIFSRQAEIVQNQLKDAIEKGAKVMTGGTIENHEGGQWLRPTIIVNVDHGMQIMREETFGPVLPVMRVGSVDEAVSLANDTSYGLSAAVFGAEQDAEAVAARVDAGGIFINDIDLVGEVGLDAEKNAFKCSGLGGSRYGPNGILRFVRKKAIVHRHDKPDEISSLAGINA